MSRYLLLVIQMMMCVFVTASSGWAQGAWLHVPLAPHLHTTFSDGKHTIAEVAAKAREAGYRAVWITDHADIYWEYPVLGSSVGYTLNSLRERGFDRYLQDCARVQAANPDLIILPGFEASPYYYWEGSPLGEKLVNHQWMKHLIVAGIEDPAVLAQLPMMAYGTSRFKPGFTDAGEAPYQDFVTAVTKAGGMAFWAHPLVDRERKLWAHISSKVTSYENSLLTVPESSGLAMRALNDVVTKPGGVWDQALLAYCSGTRPTPPWAMVELDFHAGTFPAAATVMLLLPFDTPVDASVRKTAALHAMGRGQFYVTNAGPLALRLDRWALTEAAGASVGAGETLRSDSPLTINYSLAAKNPLQWVQLVQNGVLVHQSTDPTGEWTEQDNAPRTGYYRLIARTTDGRFLLSNPIFRLPATPLPAERHAE